MDHARRWRPRRRRRARSKARRGSAWAWNSSSPRRSARCAKRKRLAEAPRAKTLPVRSSIGAGGSSPARSEVRCLPPGTGGEPPGLGEDPASAKSCKPSPTGSGTRGRHLLRLRLVGGVCHLGSARRPPARASPRRRLAEPRCDRPGRRRPPGQAILGPRAAGPSAPGTIRARARAHRTRASSSRRRRRVPGDRDGEPRRRYRQHGQVLREAMLQSSRRMPPRTARRARSGYQLSLGGWTFWRRGISNAGAARRVRTSARRSRANHSSGFF